MSRLPMLSNAVLGVAVLALSGALIARDRADAARNACASAPSPNADASALSDPRLDAIVARLARIDAALASADARAEKTSAISAHTDLVPTISPAAAAQAERRLAGLLPGDRLDHEDYVRVQASFAAFPPDERLALAAALSRAINENRVRLRY